MVRILSKSFHKVVYSATDWALIAGRLMLALLKNIIKEKYQGTIFQIVPLYRYVTFIELEILRKLLHVVSRICSYPALSS